MNASSSPGALESIGARRILRRFDWRENIVYLGFLVIFVAFAVTLGDSGFLSTNNLLNILRQGAIVGVMAVGMTLVICAAEIDLSVGALAGLASIVTAWGVNSFGISAGFLMGIGVGLVVGTVTAICTTVFGIPSFLVTLGMLGVARGTAMWISGNQPVPITNSAFRAAFGGGDLGWMPGLMLWLLGALIVGHVVLRKTAFGRYVIATGGNAIATRFSGINPDRIKFAVLVVSGVVAAIAGMLYAGRLGSGRFAWGDGDELSVIAAVVLGGTSLFGGKGSVAGAVVGALLIAMVNNGIILMGMDFSQQTLVRGAVIILAVALGRRS